MTDFAPGDRVYNRRPFFGPFMPEERKKPSRRGAVRHLMSDGWPWIRWDDGYECAVSPGKLRALSAVDELAALGRTTPEVAMLIGYCTINGVPHINMKPAAHDDELSETMLLNGALSRWRCPECNAQLSLCEDSGDHICLNLCGLSAASAHRFTSMLAEIAAKQNIRRIKLEEGKVIDALGDLSET